MNSRHESVTIEVIEERKNSRAKHCTWVTIY